MSVSQVDICNMAIERLGGQLQKISSLDGEEEEAKSCKVFYDTNLDVVLGMAPWKCAIKREQLNKLDLIPEFGFDYVFQLPSDFIRLISPDTDYEYSIEGDQLLTDETEIYIKYVYRLTDSAKYNSYLVEVLACRLAYLICVKLTGSKSLRDSIYVEMDKIMTRAENDGAFEIEDEQVRKTDSWLAARWR